MDCPVSFCVSPAPNPRLCSYLLTERIVAMPLPSSGNAAQSIEKERAQFAGAGAANNMIIAISRKPAPMKEYRRPFSAVCCSFSGNRRVMAFERKLISAPHARQNSASSAFLAAQVGQYMEDTAGLISLIQRF